MLSFPNQEQTLSAGWYGNDTVWRMVLDINTIAQYGTSSGELKETPQRTLFSLCDGIIAGQGDGPLNPQPLELGILSFTNDSFLMDEYAGYLMGMVVEKIPLLHYASEINKTKQKQITINGKITDELHLKKLSISAQMAPGWVNYKLNN